MTTLYEAARRTPQTNNWFYETDKSPDYTFEVQQALSILRNRSRALCENNDVLTGLRQAFIDSIVGTGPVIYTTDSKVDQEIKDFLKDAGVGQKESLNEILEKSVGCRFTDGEILINLPIIEGRTKVELIEAHRLQTPQDLVNKIGVTISQSRIRHGVEYYPDGRVKGYWILNANAVDTGFNKKEDFTFFPREKEFNGYKRVVTEFVRACTHSRPLASRHVPMTTPLILPIKYLADLSEAILVGMRVAACFAGFIKVTDPIAAKRALVLNQQTGHNNENRGVAFASLMPGTVSTLGQGEDITFSDPNKPSDNIDSYYLRRYKVMASTLRLPYVLAFMDVSDVTYSSWRGAEISGRKVISRWRSKEESITDWIITTRLAEAEADGRLSGGPALKTRWPVQGSLDEEKEARSNKINLENGTTSIQRICDETGKDYEIVKQEREKEALDKLELETKLLLIKKKNSEKYGIIYSDQQEEKSTDSTGDTPGGENAKEKRKTDGNW